MAVGRGQEGVEGQSIVVLAAHVIVGAAISLTVTLLLQVAVLPQSSVAMYVRVNTVGQVPLETSEPSCATSTVASTASVAVGKGQEGAAGQSMVVFAAQVITGGVSSMAPVT